MAITMLSAMRERSADEFITDVLVPAALGERLPAIKRLSESEIEKRSRPERGRHDRIVFFNREDPRQVCTFELARTLRRDPKTVRKKGEWSRPYAQFFNIRIRIDDWEEGRKLSGGVSEWPHTARREARTPSHTHRMLIPPGFIEHWNPGFDKHYPTRISVAVSPETIALLYDTQEKLDAPESYVKAINALRGASRQDSGGRYALAMRLATTRRMKDKLYEERGLRTDPLRVFIQTRHKHHVMFRELADLAEREATVNEVVECVTGHLGASSPAIVNQAKRIHHAITRHPDGPQNARELAEMTRSYARK